MGLAFWKWHLHCTLHHNHTVGFFTKLEDHYEYRSPQLKPRQGRYIELRILVGILDPK
jgi:hypothetical protein